MRIDSHQHFWTYSRHPDDFPWITESLGPLKADFLPPDLAPLLAAAGIDGSVAVQARETESETDFLLGLADDHASVLAVVGWADLCADDVAATLDRWSEARALRGLRMLVHDRDDPSFADSEPHARGVGLLAERGLSYDLLLRTVHLPAATRLVDRFENQRFVVDHLAKPAMDGSDREAWREGIAEIARRPHVFCKLSGLVTEADWSAWEASTFDPYLDAVLEAFGPQRLMIGSDWPVCTLAADYATTMDVVTSRVAALSEAERDAVLGATCARFYGIEAAGANGPGVSGDARARSTG